MKEDLKLIGFCGVDCSVCSDYVSGICTGCRESAHTTTEDCPTVTCCEGKNIEFCNGCEQFPCEGMQAFFTESESHKEAYARLKKLRENFAG